MFPPFPQELARHYCMEFISGIEDGSIIVKQVSKPSEDRQGHGFMVGSLVCANAVGERVVLYAMSGIAYEVSFIAALREPQGLRKLIVPPLVSPEQIKKALSKNDKEIHEITNKINAFTEAALREPQGPRGIGETNIGVGEANIGVGEANIGVGEANIGVGEALEPPLKEDLLSRRTSLTTESLLNVFSLYTFTRFDGKKITLNEIIQAHGGKLPPTGTGDCCAPKLLSYAFEHGLQPISMDEVFYGYKGGNTKNKTNGISYPPCDERCGYILPYILGLEILYRDSQIVVINKPSSLLSVPGRTEDKQDCVVSRLKKLFPHCIEQPSVHRLDMETSGLMVYALTKEAHRKLSMQFEAGTVHKKYLALLDGVFNHNEYQGELRLKFRLDVDNRPHQIYDEVNGKLGITEWKKEGTELYTAPDGSKRRVTKILFTPHTGRTHQLRLAASDPHGFGIPIVGDSLYGHCQPGERLMLHACELEFRHPVSGLPVIARSAATWQSTT